MSCACARTRRGTHTLARDGAHAGTRACRARRHAGTQVTFGSLIPGPIIRWGNSENKPRFLCTWYACMISVCACICTSEYAGFHVTFHAPHAPHAPPALHAPQGLHTPACTARTHSRSHLPTCTACMRGFCACIPDALTALNVFTGMHSFTYTHARAGPNMFQGYQSW